MKVVVYFINWNDSYYFPFLRKWYHDCDIIMYDQYSTDNSVSLAKSLGFEVRTFGSRQLNDQHYLDVKNHCWKEQRGKADYVIVCDADEFVTVPKNLTCSLPIVNGFNMVSNNLPIESIQDINTGAESVSYSKRAIFDPNRIKEINYVHGCHVANPVGDITEHDTCSLFHYRQIGGAERMIKRHKEYIQRMSQFNKRHRMGFHYLHEEQQKREEFKTFLEQSRELW